MQYSFPDSGHSESNLCRMERSKRFMTSNMLYGEAMPGSGFIIHNGVKIMNNEKTSSIIHQPRFNGIFEEGEKFERKIKLTDSFHINNALLLLKESLDKMPEALLLQSWRRKFLHISEYHMPSLQTPGHQQCTLQLSLLPGKYTVRTD